MSNKTLKTIFSVKMLCMLGLGFSSGVPFLIIKDVIKAWMTEESIDITMIGLFSALSMPYTFKFLWSPFMDRFTLPFLGHRRGWILLSQVALLLLIALLGQFNPHDALPTMAVVCLAIAFFSASQDIVLDAFRREYLTDEELGMGTGLWSNAYRLANLVTVGVAFALAGKDQVVAEGAVAAYKMSYSNIHFILAAMMGVGIITTLLMPEPKHQAAPPKTIKEAVVGPFMEFFQRPGAWIILGFILLYKIGDNMAGAMNIPYILSLGFEKKEYFLIVKGLGMGALFLGMFLGGIIMTRIGINRSLWIFGLLQALSTLAFSALSMTEKSQSMLSLVVVFELLTSGLGATAYSTFMATQTHKKFTATQFALMTSLMAVPGTFAAALTGFMVKYMGWISFYWVCALAAIPGMILLIKVAPWNKRRGSAQEA